VERATVREKCLVQEQNIYVFGQGSTLDHSSGVQSTNHTATAPPKKRPRKARAAHSITISISNEYLGARSLKALLRMKRVMG